MTPKLLDKLLHYFENGDTHKDCKDTAADPLQKACERCVMCGKLTDVPVTMPIDQREDYEIGCGQLCASCKQRLHNGN